MLETEFNPARIVKDSIGSIETNALAGIPTKCRTDNNFINWFTTVSSLLGNDIHLIPDTNFLRRHYYFNFLKEITSIKNNRSKDIFKIPRLTIIEIENKYNRNFKKSGCKEEYLKNVHMVEKKNE